MNTDSHPSRTKDPDHEVRKERRRDEHADVDSSLGSPNRQRGSDMTSEHVRPRIGYAKLPISRPAEHAQVDLQVMCREAAEDDSSDAGELT